MQVIGSAKRRGETPKLTLGLCTSPSLAKTSGRKLLKSGKFLDNITHS